MKCSFCDSEIKRGTGKMFVENKGRMHYWCSSKCEKNHRLGREQKDVKWARSK